MFEDRVPNLATIVGYVVMRLAMVAQWLRAAASDPEPSRRRRGDTRSASRSCRSLGRHVVDSQACGCPASSCSRRSSWRCRSGRSGRTPTTLASASHRRTVRPADADRARRIDSVGDRRGPVRPCLRRGALVAHAAHRRRAAHRLLDVVDVLRSSGSRSADQLPQGDRLGLRPLPGVCRCGGRRRRTGRQRRLRDASREDRRGRRRRGRRDTRGGLLPLPVVPPRPARVSSDEGVSGRSPPAPCCSPR